MLLTNLEAKVMNRLWHTQELRTQAQQGALIQRAGKLFDRARAQLLAVGWKIKHETGEYENEQENNAFGGDGCCHHDAARLRF